ncbi:methylglyoxal synthase [Spirulina sp. 06S082]|uniref:methylglyoxal synthase n=1 Tax=Spirulina sp. 06S082 TaxID=3110248 RepID=UPI002B214EF4|nr:methylglyoxal synthase [Spirulina sp. 06S082]MEA5467943.1 methylglyoxal synthase [Spirulina sp. 06S082]
MPASIALIAHNSQNNDLVGLVKKYRSILSGYHLMAMDKTGQQIQEATGLKIEGLLSAARGGDLQIAARIVSGEMIGVIFLFDPLQANPQEPRIDSILRACTIHDVPLAINLATAESIIRGFARSRIAYLIFNPVAGQGNPDRDLASIHQTLKPQVHLHTIYTQPDVNPVEQAKEAIAAIQAREMEEDEDPGFIIASGGDGTVSAIASATIETGIPLGIIPRGTANAFCAALGIPTDLKSACETIAAGNTRMVDVARCNDIPMILLAGVGFEAGMVEKANRELKNHLGSLAYVLSAAQQLFDQEPFKATIEMDGEIVEFQTGAVTVANAAPPTSLMAQGFGEVIPDDGLLDITIITTPQSGLQVNALASLFASALVKTPSKRKDLICLQASRLKITTDPPQKLVIDGEIFAANPVEIECIPKGLTIFTPLLTL